jgi:NAD-dependent deacetylase
MKKLVVLTGAGISAESGLRTFRDMNGLWEQYDVMEVASIEGWYRNPKLVLQFYNDRRKQLKTAEPNAGHRGLVDLEKYFDVVIITQNVDDLHEKAGSKKIIHLHGELTKIRSTKDPFNIKDIGYNELNWGDLCDKGSQFRPHIVWFGEAVPAIEEAAEISQTADAFAVIGTSLNVYPAAGLINYVPQSIPIYLIDPNNIQTSVHKTVEYIKEKAGTGVEKLKEKLFSYFQIK